MFYVCLALTNAVINRFGEWNSLIKLKFLSITYCCIYLASLSCLSLFLLLFSLCFSTFVVFPSCLCLFLLLFSLCFSTFVLFSFLSFSVFTSLLFMFLYVCTFFSLCFSVHLLFYFLLDYYYCCIYWASSHFFGHFARYNAHTKNHPPNTHTYVVKWNICKMRDSIHTHTYTLTITQPTPTHTHTHTHTHNISKF